MMRTDSSKAAWGAGLLVTLMLALLYSWTVAPGLAMGHDTGELTTCAVIQGVPHSPGYPLFVALGWLASQLPVGAEAAYRTNLLCAWETAVGIGFLAAGLALRYRFWPAFTAALLAGLSTPVWRQAVVTEVFGLHLMLLGVLIWMALLWSQSDDTRRRQIVLAACFVIGCGLAHQHILALAAPFFIGYGWLARGKGRGWGFQVLNLPILLVPLVAFYYFQYVCAQQQPTLNWSDPSSWTALVDHFLRKTYGTGMLNSASEQFDARAGDTQATIYFVSLVKSYFPFPAFLVLLLGLDRIFRNKLEPETVLFVGLAGIYGPGFALLGNQPAYEFYGDLMERFYSGSMLGLAGLAAMGIHWGMQQSQARLSTQRLALLTVILLTIGVNYGRCSQRNLRHATDLVGAMLAQIPPHSVLWIDGDLPGGTADYLKVVQRQAPTVLVIHTGLCSAPWYQQRLPAGLQRALKDATSQEAAVQAASAYYEKRGVPVYCNRTPKGLFGEYGRYGLLKRYRKDAKQLTQAEQLAESKRVLQVLLGYKRGPEYQLDLRQNFWIRYCISEWKDAFLDLARVLVNTEPEMAEQAMDQVIAIENPIRIESLINRANIRIRRSRYAEAAEDLQIVLRIQPDSQIALNSMIQAQQGLKDEALIRHYSKQLEAVQHR